MKSSSWTVSSLWRPQDSFLGVEVTKPVDAELPMTGNVLQICESKNGKNEPIKCNYISNYTYTLDLTQMASYLVSKTADGDTAPG